MGFRQLSCNLLVACCLLLAATATASPGVIQKGKKVTILYTNDIESVYEPVEAFWRDDMQRIGGMARLATLLEVERLKNPATFTLDAGDMFTGSLSKATEGRLVFDLYSRMGYDAVNLGNHEFEYGWQILHRVMHTAHQGHLIHDLGDVRQMFADLDAIGTGRNTLVRPANLTRSVGFQVEHVDV